jgi:hypothetical protein
MSANNLVALDSHALRTLAYIKESIAAAESLTVPGSAGVIMGSVGTFAAVAAQFPTLAAYWFEIWLVAAAVALAVGGWTITGQIKRRGSAVLTSPARKFVLSLCPALIAGAVLTVLLARHQLDVHIAGTWLLLYGCAVASASVTTARAIMNKVVTMGTLFMVLGIAAFELPAQWHNTLLGCGFGGLHLFFGISIGRSNHVS